MNYLTLSDQELRIIYEFDITIRGGILYIRTQFLLSLKCRKFVRYYCNIKYKRHSNDFLNNLRTF